MVVYWWWNESGGRRKIKLKNCKNCKIAKTQINLLKTMQKYKKYINMNIKKKALTHRTVIRSFDLFEIEGYKS